MTVSTVDKKKSKDEVEQALLIRGDDPAATADDIAAITKMSGYTLVEQPDQVITDTYLNTENRDIKGASLRIREVNSEKTLVTMKGKNKNAGLDKPASRTELEVEWPWTEVSPWDMVDLFGLASVQERTTNRRVRNVYYGKKLVAELAIDEVCYNFEDKVRFFEVEVEGRGDNSAVPFVVDALKKKFPALLKKWNNSKLSTGSLLHIALGINIDEEGLVTDESFDNLATLFEII